MNDNLTIEIITPMKVIYTGEATSVTLPGSKSPFQVLKNHAPIVSSLDMGVVLIINNGQSQAFITDTGFAEVNKNKVSVLVESAQNVDEIDFEATEKQINILTNKLESSNEIGEQNELNHKIQFLQNKIKLGSSLYNKYVKGRTV